MFESATIPGTSRFVDPRSLPIAMARRKNQVAPAGATAPPGAVAPRPAPVKGDRVLYHDPISGESCAATVAKVHVPGEPDSMVNLGYLTEEGLHGSACNVMHGAGRYGHWSWPDEEPAPPRDPALENRP